MSLLQEGTWKWKDHNIRYLKTNLAVDASKPPIVLIHGFGASADYYRQNLKAMAEAGYSAFALDLLGFGGSDKPLGDVVYSIELWKEQVVDFCAALCGDFNVKPVVAGNSIGGKLIWSSDAVS
jgi:pimeloyl-ACP methyl ester carboxylesterase